MMTTRMCRHSFLNVFLLWPGSEPPGVFSIPDSVYRHQFGGCSSKHSAYLLCTHPYTSYKSKGRWKARHRPPVSGLSRQKPEDDESGPPWTTKWVQGQPALPRSPCLKPRKTLWLWTHWESGRAGKSISTPISVPADHSCFVCSEKPIALFLIPLITTKYIKKCRSHYFSKMQM